MNELRVENLRVSVADQEIVRGLSLQRSARRSARTHGPKRLRKKHAGKSAGRAPRLPCDLGKDFDGRRKPPGTRSG